MRTRLPRDMVAGWPSFIHGEATAGDVLAMEAVAAEIDTAGVPHEMAWSPVFRPGGRRWATPTRPGIRSWSSPAARSAAPASRRSTSVSPPAGGLPSVSRSSTRPILPPPVSTRSWRGTVPARRPRATSRRTAPPLMPVAGVIQVREQREYADRGRHQTVSRSLASWLPGCGCALLPLEARLDSRDWRLCGTPAELESILSRVDLVITMRMHGLVLALKHGVPALAVDPVAGGAKVTAQAEAWHSRAVVAPGAGGTSTPAPWTGGATGACRRRAGGRPGARPSRLPGPRWPA